LLSQYYKGLSISASRWRSLQTPILSLTAWVGSGKHD